ncbi:transcriptional regulator [Pantoea sp. JZ2]|uniref:helix-turn-helix domain-containing protein n=1 Tax=Pantoea sp. JZ2 TaxID=2654189 RepID=UPI002B48BDE1|nr:helix-turn-helix transcriptional regulator [Pantoea sp. JZ2]WRH12314.1 transcriptional regulator [Pantoea sp. JZ2]
MQENLKSVRKNVSPNQWLLVAKLSGTSVAYLNQIALGFRRPSVSLAEKIAAAVSQVSPGLSISKESLVFAPLRQSDIQDKSG